MKFVVRTRSCFSIVAALTLVALGLAPHRGRAQATSVPSVLAGSWRLEADPARAMRTVEAAFGPSLAALPELFQPIARGRIQSSMQPPRRVEVTLATSRVRVTLASDHTATIDGPLGAAATTSGVDDGTRVTPRIQAGWLELFYEGESSELHQLLSTEPDGSRMHLDYTVVNERLAGQVRYRLDYVRAQ